MNIVNIGTDKTLVGGKKLGDAIERHKKYGEFVEHLDIIVYTHKAEGLTTFKISDNVTGHPSNSRSKLNFIFDAQKIFRQILKQHPVDIIVCQDPFIPGLIGWRLKKKYGCKLQVNFHGDFWDNPVWLKERWLNWLFLLISKFVVPRADTIRVVSEGIKQKLIKRGIAAYNIYKISTPVNLAQFAAGPAEESSGKKIVLTVGRIVKAKDFPTLIKTARAVYQAVPDFEWQIIGDGPLLKKLQSATKDQPYIKWLGQIEHDQLTNYYRRAAVVVLTSNNESFGKVFLEAAMSGVPAVATNTVGAQEIIKDGESGYIVTIGDWQSLAERIVYLLNNPAIALAMGQRAQEIVSTNFDPSKNIASIVSMWRQTVGGK